MKPDDLHFEKIKEYNGTYILEYAPPIPSYPFATLTLTFPNAATKKAIVEAIETETRKWLKRYPIRIMASAYDNTGTPIDLTPERNENILWGRIKEGNDGVELCWSIERAKTMPQEI